MTKWQPLVKRNREATQLDFREDPNAQHKNLSNKQNSNEFKTISVIDQLPKADPSGLDFTVQESQQKELMKSELLKNKHLLLYQELKAKRLKKIKSKLFRRIKKKQREKEHDKTLNVRISNNKEAVFEEIEKLERKRAEVGS